ncbi:hypothetical protein DFH01_09700 [Falsiroseomonas bella]|uniref:Uncharacterized protein n=2 Tax=Falsiroseomonas bella TaxID=2184016 RepID=A0A317FFG9_9PROT|nr:hypothetical protein DFH01_09700 [Falsiroseomonas bella]
MDPERDQRVLGELLQELADRATRHLRKRVNRNLPNEGLDLIQSAVDKMVDAALGPDSPDAEGFCQAFYARLSFRLTDRIRSASRIGDREQPYVRDEEGNEIPAPDFNAINPEQALVIKELLADVDPRKRRALALVSMGYLVSSADPDKQTVSSLLKVSPRTAEGWVREMKALILERTKQ